MGRKSYRATMKDVARRAGVTVGTVSHVINHTAPISEETTKRVCEAIEALDYVPNNFARSMRTKVNKHVGLMIPNLTNDFHSRIASNFVDMATKYKYIVHIMGYEYSLEREMDEMRSLLEYNVGTVVIVNGENDEEAIQELVEKGVHVILVDRRSDLKEVPYIEFDNRNTYCKIVGCLKEKGYKSIGFVCEPLGIINLKDRYEGYLDGLKKNGYKFDPDHVYISERLYLDYMKNSYLYMKDVLKTKKREELPDAFIITSDLLAIGVMRAIHEAGYRVPRDFGVIGCDNLLIAGYTFPRLSTVEQNREVLCQEIWKMILSLDEGKKPDNIVLPQEIVWRESC